MPDTRKLIEQTIIIEGLLRNIGARDGQTNPDELALLQAKFEEFQEEFYSAFPPFYDSEAPVFETVEEVIDEIPEQWTNPVDTVIEEPALDQYQPEPEPYQPEPTPYQPEPQPTRVDEALSRRKAEDLSKAFTINDKFRFTQELFDGSIELMNDQIAYIENFDTLQQAREFLFSTNNWDQQNPAVKEFMEIVARHFQQ